MFKSSFAQAAWLRCLNDTAFFSEEFYHLYSSSHQYLFSALEYISRRKRCLMRQLLLESRIGLFTFEFLLFTSAHNIVLNAQVCVTQRRLIVVMSLGLQKS